MPRSVSRCCWCFLKHRICSGITSSRSPLTQILWDLWQAAAQSTRQDAHLSYGRFMMWQCCLYYLQNRRAVGSTFHVTETKTSWSSSVLEGKILSWQYNACWDQVDLLYVTDGKRMFWAASTNGIYGNIPVVWKTLTQTEKWNQWMKRLRWESEQHRSVLESLLEEEGEEGGRGGRVNQMRALWEPLCGVISERRIMNMWRFPPPRHLIWGPPSALWLSA